MSMIGTPATGKVIRDWVKNQPRVGEDRRVGPSDRRRS